MVPEEIKKSPSDIKGRIDELYDRLNQIKEQRNKELSECLSELISIREEYSKQQARLKSTKKKGLFGWFKRKKG